MFTIVKKKTKKNTIVIDIEKIAFDIWGVNLMRIPGVSDAAVLKLLGELGHNFTDKFDTHKEFCNWCNLAPNNKITGGKLLSSKIPKRKNPVGLILRSCANSLNASKTPLGYYFRRIQSKSGYLPAIVATAHKLAKIIYVMVKTKTEFDDTKNKFTEKEILQKKLRHTQKKLERLEKQLNDAVLKKLVI
jgi:hypothetical protein